MGVAVGRRALDARLEVAARDVLGAREVAGRELVGLAHVDDDRAVAELALDVGGVDLVDLGADLLDDLGPGRAHLKSPEWQSGIGTSISIAPQERPDGRRKARAPPMEAPRSGLKRLRRPLPGRLAKSQALCCIASRLEHRAKLVDGGLARRRSIATRRGNADHRVLTPFQRGRPDADVWCMKRLPSSPRSSRSTRCWSPPRSSSRPSWRTCTSTSPRDATRP